MTVEKMYTTKNFQNNFLKVRRVLDTIYSESDTLVENFGEEICKEITEYITENHYTPNEKIVKEALFWGYISRMQ